MGARWTKKEIRLALSNIPAREVAKTLGRTEAAVWAKRSEFGYSVHEGIYAPEYFSFEEKEYRIYKKAKELGIRIQ